MSLCCWKALTPDFGLEECLKSDPYAGVLSLVKTNEGAFFTGVGFGSGGRLPIESIGALLFMEFVGFCTMGFLDRKLDGGRGGGISSSRNISEGFTVLGGRFWGARYEGAE